MDVHRILAKDVTPEEFYRDFVRARLPAVFSDHIPDKSWKGALWTDHSYLKQKAGDLKVRVERRSDAGDVYGRGREEFTPFCAFLKRVEASDETIYLTTQELEYSIEGRPSLYSHPVTGLLDDFPPVPAMCGNLIPQNVNIWMGCSNTPSSSGLHHDFHDNLYVLLKGEKHFTIYDSSEAANMYTVGSISKIHPNGRINYEKLRPTNADGSDVSSSAALEASISLGIAAALLCRAQEAGEDEDEADEALDKALEAVLDAETAGDDFDENDYDDYNDEEKEEEDVVSVPIGIKRVASAGAGQISSKSSRLSVTAAQPPNFSKVDTRLPDEQLLARFPLYAEARQRRIDLTLKAGEMLFLPAGYFHEVRSSGGEHMAFNYWFHPAETKEDVCSFENPYSSTFWKQDWDSRAAFGKV